MGHHTDQEEVSPTSPRRQPAKPVANAKEYKKRLVPLQHNAGRPIVIAKPPPGELGKLRRACKKAFRKRQRHATLQAAAAATAALPHAPSLPETRAHEPSSESHAET
jgi:hypothetical protein